MKLSFVLACAFLSGSVALGLAGCAGGVRDGDPCSSADWMSGSSICSSKNDVLVCPSQLTWAVSQECMSCKCVEHSTSAVCEDMYGDPC